MADEQFGILVLRAVIGVRVENELRIRDVLLQDEEFTVGTMTSLLPFTTSVG